MDPDAADNTDALNAAFQSGQRIIDFSSCVFKHSGVIRPASNCYVTTNCTLAPTDKTAIAGTGNGIMCIFGHFGDDTLDFENEYSAFQRPKRLAQVAHPASPRFAIQDTAARDNKVTANENIDAALVNSGDLICISCGKNRYDADDSLFRYSRIFEVVDSDVTTGEITLDRNLEELIESDGFDAQAGKYYNPPNYAQNFTYSAGDAVYDPDSDSIYETPTGGVSNGVSVADDTAVVWERITTELGAQHNTAIMDGSPILTVINKGIKNVHIDGLTIKPDSSFSENGYISGIRIKNAIVDYLNVKVHGQSKLSEGVSISEQSLVKGGNISVVDVSHVVSNSKDRCLVVYNSEAYLDRVEFANTPSSSLSDSCILVESGAKLEINKGILNGNAASISGSSAVTVIGHSSFSYNELTVLNYNRAIKSNGSIVKVTSDGRIRAATIRGNVINGKMSNQGAFRLKNDTSLAADFSMFQKGQISFLEDPNQRLYQILGVKQVSYSLTPSAGMSNARFPLSIQQLAKNGIHGGIHSVWVLGCQYNWLLDGTEDASASIQIGPQRVSPGPRYSNLFHSSGSANRSTLSIQKPTKNSSHGGGNIDRLFNLTSDQDIPAMNIYSSNPLSTAGTSTLIFTWDLLVLL